MNDDDRLSRYLSEQADSIPLTPADPAAVMRRGARRRNQRRGTVLGTVAILGVVATSVALRDGGDDTPVELDSASAVVVPSAFEWSVAHPASGLGYSSSQVTLADGAVYSLSTAPGPALASVSGPPTLYRSDDDTEWDAVSLPGYISASSLAASGDTLYAIGTSPAGGGSRTLVVAASSDGADTWQRLELPQEVAALDARHPGVIRLSQPSVAAQDATHLVASVVVSAQPDVQALLPGENLEAGWEMSPEGVTVMRLEDCDEPTCNGTIIDDARFRSASMAGDEGKMQTTVPGRTYTWDELGLDPELKALITGRTFLYASDDGATFEPVSVPGETSGWGSSLVAGPDGYRLFVGGSYTAGTVSTTHLYTSADGHTWEADGTLPGQPSTAGLLGDRVAIALYDDMGGTSIRVHQPDGTWSTLDLTAALSAAGADVQRWTNLVAFGPLGVAAVVGEQESIEATTSRTYVVHSTDGSTVSAVSVDDAFPDRDGISVDGLRVGTDAVTVRINDGVDGDPTTVATQTLFVGTPTD